MTKNKGSKKSKKIVNEKIEDNQGIKSNVNVEKAPALKPLGKMVTVECIKKVNFGKLEKNGQFFLFQEGEVKECEYREPYAYWIDWGVQHGFLKVVGETSLHPVFTLFDFHCFVCTHPQRHTGDGIRAQTADHRCGGLHGHRGAVFPDIQSAAQDRLDLGDRQAACQNDPLRLRDRRVYSADRFCHQRHLWGLSYSGI